MKKETRNKTNGSAALPNSDDSNAVIARRAYDIWLNEGGSHGHLYGLTVEVKQGASESFGRLDQTLICPPR